MKRTVSPSFPASLWFLVALAAVFAGILPTATASAATVRVSASAQVRMSGINPSTVAFKAKTNRKARVRVTVLKGRTTVRSFALKKVAGGYASNWNLRNSRNRRVGLGTYTYKVSAVAIGKKKTVRHSFNLHQAGTMGGRWLGFYVQGDLVPNTAALAQVESLTGVHSRVVNMFVTDSEGFPSSRCKAVAARGAVPMVTLEFNAASSGGVQAITNGVDDAKLIAFAKAAKTYGKEVRLRPFHEMNGNWYPWCGTVGSNSPAKVIAAWKHVHSIFTTHGATNVKFVWCVNGDSVPNTTANSISSYWPGTGYVDYLAIDAYNFGTYNAGSKWRSFSESVAYAYPRVTALSGKPLFMAEAGCAEQGGQKSAWVANMFQVIPQSFPRISGVCWFNSLKGEDWRVESSADSLSAFKAGAATF